MKIHLMILYSCIVLPCCSMEKKEQQNIIIRHNGVVKAVQWSKDESRLFFTVKSDNPVKYDYHIAVYDATAGKTIKELHCGMLDTQFLRQNKKFPLFLLPKRKRNRTICSLYDRKDCKKLLSLEGTEYGFALDDTIFYSLFGTTLTKYFIETKEAKKFDLSDKVELYSISKNSEHFMLYTKSNSDLYTVYHYDIKQDKETLLGISYDGSRFMFNQSSTNISFFDVKKSSIKIYDTEKRMVIKEFKTEKPVKNYCFFSSGRILFTMDNTTFLLWDINNDEVNVWLQFDTEHTIQYPRMSKSSGKNKQEKEDVFKSFNDKDKKDSVTPLVSQSTSHDIIYFTNEKNGKVTVYDSLQNKTYTLDTDRNEGNRSIRINHNKTYAIYQSRNTIFAYSMDTWKLLNQLTFDKADTMIFEFSPCGNYAAIGYIIEEKDDDEKGYVEVYDIKNGRIIFKTSYIDKHDYFTFWRYFIFCPYGILGIKSDHKKLLLYDYYNNTSETIETEEILTNYAFTKLWIATLSGKQTKLIKYSENIDHKNNDFTLKDDSYCTIL